MSEAIISVENLGKCYRIKHQARHEQYTALRDVLVHSAHTLMRNTLDVLRGHQPVEDESVEEFWALRDVSFSLRPGEVIGIIGRNGAGKSTLLKILSRITEPTEGRVTLRGRVASLLEVGTGFHLELTGRENIFLNGAILGMSKAEISGKFDEIVAFAEVERFLDTPVKRYSSGMYVRLAFAVAAHLEPEILIVDEVLAVGDAEFQRKCLGKMQEVSEGGRTVLFVSHNMAVIQRLCSQSLLLERGLVKEIGPTDRVVQRYLSSESTDGLGNFDQRNRSGHGWARFTALRLLDEDARPVKFRGADQDLIFEFEVQVLNPKQPGVSLKGLVAEFMFFDSDGSPVTSVMNVDDPPEALPASGMCRMQMRLPGPTFVPGRYYINLFLGIPFVQHVDEIQNALSFEISVPVVPWRPYELSPKRGCSCRKAIWKQVI